jgi:hypothetical protein
MKKQVQWSLLVVLILILSGCNLPGSESQVQTEVAAALETAAADQTETAKIEALTREAEDQLQQQQAETEQAKILNQTETAMALVTNTPEATETPSASDTPTPISTPEGGGLPDDQKVVVAKGNTAWWQKKGENKAGYPIMVKTNPVKRFEAGQVFRVYKMQILADGGGYYYMISGPVGVGYYVAVGDVRDQ